MNMRIAEPVFIM